MKREDVEYILHDFLEVRYGTNELENARIVQFLLERMGDGHPGAELRTLAGFLMSDVLVVVVSDVEKAAYRECLLLNSGTRQKMHYRQPLEAEKLIW